ncbi:MAG: hypothetical protein H0V70_13435 [Ktedonobacteraceae bacterium]|nr:hypothetical protein [Ktedonobacteraceae bacterium]
MQSAKKIRIDNNGIVFILSTFEKCTDYFSGSGYYKWMGKSEIQIAYIFITSVMVRFTGSKYDNRCHETYVILHHILAKRELLEDAL